MPYLLLWGVPMMGSAFIVNSALAAERFAGEAVLINIEKGLYYSIQGAALDIYDSFSTPRNAVEALEHLARQLAGADHSLLERAFQELLTHGLIVESHLPPQISAAGDIGAREFILPSISVFDDLAELIALDPVHEVDVASGWPVRPPSFSDVV